MRGGISASALPPGGIAGYRTRVLETYRQSSFTCVVAVSPATEFVDSATTYFSCAPRSPTRDPLMSQPL